MNRIILGLALASSLMGQTARIHMNGMNWPSRMVDVRRDGGRVAMEARQGRVSGQAAGRPYHGDVITIFDAASGLYWWTLQGSASAQEEDVLAAFLNSRRLEMRGDRLLVFSFRSPELGIREAGGRASSMEDAQKKAVVELDANWEAIQSQTYRWGTTINLRQALGDDFLYLRGSNSAFPPPTLRSVSHEGGRWRIVLDGPNRDTATVLLTEDLELISAQSPQ